MGCFGFNPLFSKLNLNRGSFNWNFEKENRILSRIKKKSPTFHVGRASLSYDSFLIRFSGMVLIA